MQKQMMVNCFKSVVILFFSTLVSYVFMDMGIRIENIVMVYLVAVLLIVIETRSLAWSVFSSVASVLSFNFFFTDPKLTLMIDDPNYIVTIVIFLIVSFITSSLVSKMQMHARNARYNEQQTNTLFKMNSGYLNISGIDNIIQFFVYELFRLQGIRIVIYYFNEKENQLFLYRDSTVEVDEASQQSLAKWCFDNRCACGTGTAFYDRSPWVYTPMYHGNDTVGVYAIYQGEKENSEEFKMFVDTLITQLLLAIDRELLYSSQEDNKVEIEKEKLRNNLLRSLSHDLRTPLTGIAGNSSFILQKYDSIDKDTMINLIQNIDEDANWLNSLVENLLNMTRIQDGKLILKKQNEVVDDILCAVNERAQRIKKDHQLQIHMPQDVLLVAMDGKLIIQVLLNLIDNACKHTKDDSIIDIYVKDENKGVRFEVCDNGVGIDKSIEHDVFDSFVTTGGVGGDSNRGVGLGLSIAKSIVEAHGGNIYGKNREEGGAIFGFTLPKEKTGGKL